MDPRRTPEKVLTGHLCDQLANFAGHPRAPTAPAQGRLGLDDDQAVTPFGPPAREQDPNQPISTAKALATSSAALQHGDLMAKRDRFQQQRRAGSRFAASGHQE